MVIMLFWNGAPFFCGVKQRRRGILRIGGTMNNNLKYGLFFLGGVALGAIGAVAVSRGKLDLKPLATDLISRGLEVKDAVLAKADAVREDVEDMMAEARAASEQRKAHPEEA